MIYVVDSNILRSLLFHFPKKGKIYELVWSSLDAGIKANRIISVDECFNELKRQFSKDTYALKWINAHLGMFQKPDDKESIIIRDLFMDRKMRESIHEKNITDNRPSADVYLVAKAKAIGGTVVTEEKYKQNSAQLPNICEKLGVRYASYDEFMEIVDNNIDAGWENEQTTLLNL